jgi:hypothetical protein
MAIDAGQFLVLSQIGSIGSVTLQSVISDSSSNGFWIDVP